MAVAGDEDVLRLEVAVDDAGRVQALDALDDLRGVEPGAVAAEAAPPCELGCEIAAWMEVLNERGEYAVTNEVEAPLP